MAAPRNPYEDEIDFSALALTSPDFNKFLKANGQLDFSNPDAVSQLTKSLLKRDFGLRLELPKDRLCPPVPNRLNYILWVQDLLDSTSGTLTDRCDPTREVIGLDIGTGASCIYPLLGCVQRPKWKFIATDIDEKNLQYAHKNVLANDLKDRIRVVQRTPSQSLVLLDDLRIERINFTMSNPPFYASASEMLSHAAEKSRPPYSACTGAEVEMVTPGGETAFIGRMIEESQALKERVQWYSSMVGKLSNVTIVVEKLKTSGVRNWAVNEFVQGGKTRRWGVAWSWDAMRPSLAAARGSSSLPKHLYAFPSEYHFSLDDASLEVIGQNIDETIRSLDMRWQYRATLLTGVGFAAKNVWSRSVRRRQGQKMGGVESQTHPSDDHRMDEGIDGEEGEEEDSLALAFKITVRQDTTKQHKGSTAVEVRWLQGHDSVLFESFCGMLKRAVTK